MKPSEAAFLAAGNSIIPKSGFDVGAFNREAASQGYLPARWFTFDKFEGTRPHGQMVYIPDNNEQTARFAWDPGWADALRRDGAPEYKTGATAPPDPATAMLANTGINPATGVYRIQPPTLAEIESGRPSSSSPTAASLGLDDDGMPLNPAQAKGPGAIFRPDRNGQTRGEGAVSARSELLARTAEGSGVGRLFDISLPDITGGIGDIINALRPRLPGGTPPLLPPPPGMGGAMSAGRGSLRGLGKIFATLTAAGLTTEAIVALMSSGVIKVPKRKRGITYSELRGFNKMCGLLGRVGMQPRKLHRAPAKKKKC